MITDSTNWYSLEKGACIEYWNSSTSNAAEFTEDIQNTVDFLRSHDAQAVSIRLFGTKDEVDRASGFLVSVGDEIVCPPLKIIQAKGEQPTAPSFQIHAVSGSNSQPLYFEGDFIGRVFEDPSAKYYMVNLVSGDPSQSKYSQTKDVLDKAAQILTSNGLDFSNTIRTWLYASDILSWYDALNKARNDFFTEHSIYDKIVPASTGIGVDNADGCSLAMQLLAVDLKADHGSIQPANSPLQSSALDYKSSFSRGIRLLMPDHQRLTISGTASIDKEGNTVFCDDTPAQINLTMQVVKGILDEADMDWSNVVSSLAYFKSDSDFELFDQYCGDHEIFLPHVKIHADVCRDDLLFELELEAAKPL